MERSCYNCKYNMFCFLRHELNLLTTKGLQFLNIDNPKSAPKGFTELYTTLAECCMKYEESENG